MVHGFVAFKEDHVLFQIQAAVVSGDEVRGLYLERMKALEAVLRKQRVERNVIK